MVAFLVVHVDDVSTVHEQYSWRLCEYPWRLHGDCTETSWKLHENSVESSGDSMETRGDSMEIHEDPYRLHGDPSRPIDSHGCTSLESPWMSPDLHESP